MSMIFENKTEQGS